METAPPTQDNAASQRVAIVTGASRGIGLAIARALAAQGPLVVLMARNADLLEQARASIQAEGGRAETRACDVSDAQSLAGAIEAVAEAHGRLDILVNNAGITRDDLLMRMSDEAFDEVIQTNLRSVFVACRAALRPMMKKKWGRVVNIGSVAGLVGNAGQANYAAAKAGLVGFTRSLAKEMAAKKITANVVAPGFIETDMTQNLPQKVKDTVLQITPAGRFGEVQEVAAAVAFLCSEQAGYVTGQTLAVDGGMTMC
jgi:3-oxoacyl-[acyl-carrier protein] reductase